MSEKFSLLKAKYEEHKNLKGLMDKSLFFWKNDVKISKLGNACCCQRDEIVVEEPKIKGGVTEELPFYEPVKKNTTIFKTIKKDMLKNQINDNNNVGKLENLNSEVREKKKYNDWNKDEDNLLLRLCKSHYYKKWKKIATIIGNGKTPRMCAYRIKKLEKEENKFNFMKLKQFDNLNKKVKEQDKFLKDSVSTKSEKSSSFIELKKRKKMRKLINFRLPKTLKPMSQRKDSVKNECLDNNNYNKTINDFKNLKIDEFLEPIAKNNSNENKTSERGDHEMKSNSSHDRSKNHIQWFNFSRKNSPEEEIVLCNRNSNDFKNAYDNVFGYKKEKYSGSELNRNTSMEDETEMGLKENHTEKINQPYINNTNNQKNEMNIKHGNANKYYYLDLKNVEQIVNNNKEDIESKNIKLAKILIEINNLTKIANPEEIKTLMQIQAKILESMITLTKHSQIQNRDF